MTIVFCPQCEQDTLGSPSGKCLWCDTRITAPAPFWAGRPNSAYVTDRERREARRRTWREAKLRLRQNQREAAKAASPGQSPLRSQ